MVNTVLLDRKALKLAYVLKYVSTNDILLTKKKIFFLDFIYITTGSINCHLNKSLTRYRYSI